MDTPSAATEPAATGTLSTLWSSIRTRIISGLLFMLPIAITIWIVTWVYNMLRGLVLDPTAHLVQRLAGLRSSDGMPVWWEGYISPLTSAILALFILYLLGYFVSTRLSRAVEWILLKVPGVTIVYKAVRNVFHSIGGSSGGSTFKRVVLVEFPHPGLRALAFVTKSMRDTKSGDSILCVCVLTGVMPPSGFTLFVAEKDAIDVPWSINDSLQIILSGGITSPSVLPFVKGAPAGLILPDHPHPGA